jgi:WXXGXW repeat (2 copies)
MKKKILAPLVLFLFIWIIPGCTPGYVAQDNGAANNSTSPGYNNQDNSSDYDEYNVDDLNQYGEWENVNQYGRVWHPSVINNWQPFTNGHWAYDGNDWVWVSYEPFGWIVYHYGSWEFSTDYGWLWIPGRDAWSPARVQWIDYGDNIGWAPMRANNRNWPEPWENNNVHPWMVVRQEDFNRENIISYDIPSVSRGNNNQNLIQRRQPDIKSVQSHLKDPIKIVKIDKEPSRIETPPVRTNTLPVKNDNPPLRTDPQVRNDNPPVKTYSPTVKNNDSPVRTNTPPVAVTNRPNSRPIVHMQVPQEEKQKVDRYSPKVVKNVLIKKNPRPVINTVPKTDVRNSKPGDDKK